MLLRLLFTVPGSQRCDYHNHQAGTYRFENHGQHQSQFRGSNRAIRDYDRIGTNQYFELYWEAYINQYTLNTDKIYSADSQQRRLRNLVGKLMGGGLNPYGSRLSATRGTDGKLADGAVPLWNVDWQKEIPEQQALRTEIGGECLRRRKDQPVLFLGWLSGRQRHCPLSPVTNVSTCAPTFERDNPVGWCGGVNMSYAHSIQNHLVLCPMPRRVNVINAGRLMPDFIPRYEMNADGT